MEKTYVIATRSVAACRATGDLRATPGVDARGTDARGTDAGHSLAPVMAGQPAGRRAAPQRIWNPTNFIATSRLRASAEEFPV